MGVIGCKKCSPQEMSASRKPRDGISFAEEPGVKFETVGYIKELSPGGKAALSLDEMNE